MAKINWFPGHMNKALRQIQTALNEADFVLELRDARAPLASSNPLLEQLVEGKPRLLVLNKVDLADPLHNTAWQQHLTSASCKVIGLSLAQQQNKQKLLRALQQNFGGQKSKGPKGAQWCRAARGLVLGIPNVGKSTLINSLLGRQKLKVEDRAGVTRQTSLIHLNKNYSLFDSPGMLWPNLEDQQAAARLTLMGSLKDQVVEEDQLLCYFVQELERLYPGLLQAHYALAELEELDLSQLHTEIAAAVARQEAQARELQTQSNASEIDMSDEGQAVPGYLLPGLDMTLLYQILDALGRRLQCLEKGGRIAYRRLLSRLLRDFQQGKLGRLSLEHCAGLCQKPTTESQ